METARKQNKNIRIEKYLEMKNIKENEKHDK